MLTLAFNFLAGRYHATPWDRHVNEGAVAWPPEPWRVLRALVAAWHHKVKHCGRHREATLSALIESLADELPVYMLPTASHSHTRHYMPLGKAGVTSLVFDAFTAVERDSPLYIAWPNADLPEEQTLLLDELLSVMGYLGRAESWVEARRVEVKPEPNCLPAEEQTEAGVGQLKGEIATLLAPLQAHQYGARRERFLAGARAPKTVLAALPVNLLDALSVGTDELRKQGWSEPPAARKVSYLRPLDALRPRREPRKERSSSFTTVRYLLIGKPLPRVEDTVRIGELLRIAAMSEARRQFGQDAIPGIFSGHGLPEGNRHEHAFYLPWDANGDGRIDRLVLHVPASMGRMERRVVEKLRRIWREGGEWQLVLESIGSASVGGLLMERASRWESITPYLHPWHAKKGFAAEDQIRRECRERGLSEPVAFERLERISVGKQARRAIHFHRFRNKRGLNQPDRHGTFWRLTFAEPVEGPLALGFGCHFGLGLFVPVSDSKMAHVANDGS